jgi:hypothetical protein
MTVAMSRYGQGAFSAETFEAIAWKGNFMGITAEAVAEQYDRNVDAALSILNVAGTGIGRAIDLQVKRYETTAGVVNSLCAAMPITPKHGANLAGEAVFTALSDICEAHEIASSTMAEIFGMARRHTVESAQRIRRHIKREDLY